MEATTATNLPEYLRENRPLVDATADRNCLLLVGFLSWYGPTTRRQLSSHFASDEGLLEEALEKSIAGGLVERAEGVLRITEIGSQVATSLSLGPQDRYRVHSEEGLHLLP